MYCIAIERNTANISMGHKKNIEYPHAPMNVWSILCDIAELQIKRPPSLKPIPYSYIYAEKVDSNSPLSYKEYTQANTLVYWYMDGKKLAGQPLRNFGWNNLSFWIKKSHDL